MKRLLANIAAACLLVGSLTAAAARADVQFKSTPVATGLVYPLGVTSAPGDRTHLYIVLQRGQIRVVDVSPTGTYSMRPTPLVDLTSQLSSTYLEYGVLGIAFHPNFADNGYFYVTYTPGSSQTLADYAILRFKVSAADHNVADMSTQTTILRIPYTITQHRAGWIAFGPDGYLYATTGDGGENDPSNAGSDRSVLRGKVLRIDVNGPDGIPGTADDDGFPADANKNYQIPATNPFVGVANAAPEIWAYGLRNPWRASFDRQTGDMWIGDVGQNLYEEVDFQPAGVGGLFYGWRCMEGLHRTTFAECQGTLPASTPPVLEYPHSGTGVVTGTSVTGGYVYRGCAMPSIRGTYFFGDWGGKIWTATRSGSTLTNIVNRTAELAAPGTMVSFGEDALGELYFVNWSSSAGAVYKIEPRTLDGPDCNGNGRSDACDIALGFSQDANGNGIPDECEMCAADFNHVGGLNTQDIFDYLNAWLASDPATDFNHNGTLEQVDIFVFINAWFAGC